MDMKPPKMPEGYRRMGVLERRMFTPATLLHNRRMGWLLRLNEIDPDLAQRATRVGLHTRRKYVREHLPDLFPANMPGIEITPYVSNLDDQDLI